MRFSLFNALLATFLIFSSCTKASQEATAPTHMHEGHEMPEGTAGEMMGDMEAAKAVDADSLNKIEIYTETIDGTTYWVPAEITVKAGQKYLLVAKHEVEGGFAFHGLSLREFGVLTQVNRNQELKTVIEIPANKAGTYNIGCQFHPAHKPAKLIVE
jgi:plastocyanin